MCKRRQQTGVDQLRIICGLDGRRCVSTLAFDGRLGRCVGLCYTPITSVITASSSVSLCMAATFVKCLAGRVTAEQVWAVTTQ